MKSATGKQGMKKIIILVMLLFFSVSVYSEIKYKRDGNGLLDAYEDRPNGYIVIKETELLDMATGMPLQGRTLLPGTIFSPSFLGDIRIDSLPYNGGRLKVVDYHEDNINAYISLDDIAVDQSEVLPDSILFRENREPDYYWLPSHTIDIIQSRKRDTIFLYEKGRPEYGYDYNIMIWHEGDPSPLTLELTNTTFDFRFLEDHLDTTLIKHIGYNGQYYTVVFAVINKDLQKAAYRFYYNDVAYIYNFPNIYGSRPSALLVELNAAQNRMRIYNGETKRIVLDLIKVSADFYDNYIEFIQTGVVPGGLVIPPELLAGWPGDIVISPFYAERRKISYTTVSDAALYVMPDTESERITALPGRVTPLEPGMGDTINGVTGSWVWVETAAHETGWCFTGDIEPLEAPTHRTTSSLRLRSAQGTTGAIITTLPEGELITVLETGDTAVIDGIRAPWVRVQVRNGSRGWCFSGYLESIIKTEPVTEPVFENDMEEAETQPAYFSVSPMLRQKSKAPAYIWFAAGGAVLIAGICVIVIIALKRRKR